MKCRQGVENQRHSLKNKKHLYFHLGTVASIVMLCCLSCGVLSSMKPANMQITRQLIGCSVMEAVCLNLEVFWKFHLEGFSFCIELTVCLFSEGRCQNSKQIGMVIVKCCSFLRLRWNIKPNQFNEKSPKIIYGKRNIHTDHSLLN